MPPKRSPPSSSAAKRPQNHSSNQGQAQGAASTVGQALRNTYETLTARENQGVVRAVGMFGVAVAIFASSYSDFAVAMVPV